MSLRIVTTKDRMGTTLMVSGRLVGPWIAELGRSFVVVTDRPVVVDVSDVSFVASDGVALLLRIVERGGTLRGCPAYLEPQLHGAKP